MNIQKEVEQTKITNEKKKNNSNYRTKHKWRMRHQNMKEKMKDRIKPVSRAEALIPDDMILIRADRLVQVMELDDATSRDGR